MIAFAIACATCTKYVPQEKATGSDGRVKGAKTIILENGEGKVSGIVTYPGGDRVDWKFVELPKDKVGTLALRLAWTPPRAGLALGVDVFDEYGRQVASAKGGKKKTTLRRSRKTEVSPAKGKYYIRVYAVNRGDAGKYRLTVSFAEQTVDLFDIKSLEIPDPPKLPAVPEPEVPCDEFAFDKKNPACRGVCPNPPDPGWPACQGRCPVPPDINNPACWATMPCPNPPDRRIKACPKTAFPKCNPDLLDPQNPNCDNYRPEPVRGQVINVQVSGDGAIITINRGMERGVQQGWKGKILKKGSSRGLEGGDFTVVKAGKRDSVAKVRLTTDQVQANPDVLLEAP